MAKSSDEPAEPKRQPRRRRVGVKLGEIVRAILALTIVLGGFVFIWVAWGTRSLDDARGIATLMAGLMGAVMGYYFGARGVDHAEKAVAIAQNQLAQASHLAARGVDAVAKQEQWALDLIGAAQQSKDAEFKSKVLEVVRGMSS